MAANPPLVGGNAAPPPALWAQIPAAGAAAFQPIPLMTNLIMHAQRCGRELKKVDLPTLQNQEQYETWKRKFNEIAKEQGVHQLLEDLVKDPTVYVEFEGRDYIPEIPAVPDIPYRAAQPAVPPFPGQPLIPRRYGPHPHDEIPAIPAHNGWPGLPEQPFVPGTPLVPAAPALLGATGRHDVFRIRRRELANVEANVIAVDAYAMAALRMLSVALRTALSGAAAVLADDRKCGNIAEKLQMLELHWGTNNIAMKRKLFETLHNMKFNAETETFLSLAERLRWICKEIPEFVGEQQAETIIMDKLIRAAPKDYAAVVNEIENARYQDATQVARRLQLAQDNFKDQKKRGKMSAANVATTPIVPTKRQRREYKQSLSTGSEETRPGTKNGNGDEPANGRDRPSTCLVSQNTHPHIKCHRCGKMGHYANKCDGVRVEYVPPRSKSGNSEKGAPKGGKNKKGPKGGKGKNRGKDGSGKGGKGGKGGSPSTGKGKQTA